MKYVEGGRKGARKNGVHTRRGWENVIVGDGKAKGAREIFSGPGAKERRKAYQETRLTKGEMKRRAKAASAKASR